MHQRRNGLVAAMIAVTMLVMAMAGAGAQYGTPLTESGGDSDLQASASWLLEQQAEDGGFPGMSGENEPSVTIDAIIALAAAEKHGVETNDAIDAAVSWLVSGDTALVFAQTGQGQAAKLVLGAVAAGIDPTNIAGVNPVALLDAGVNPDTGLYGSGVFDHALVLLALAAVGSDVPENAISALEETRTPEGGWAYDGTATSGAADSNTTALVVQALVAAGKGDSPLVADALAYLKTAIEGSGGAVFQPDGGTPPDSSSTALVSQAILASGEDPSSERWGNLTAALAEYQNESGAFFFNADDQADNLFSTVQAIPALAGESLPVVPAMNGATPVASPVAAAPITSEMAA